MTLGHSSQQYSDEINFLSILLGLFLFAPVIAITAMISSTPKETIYLCPDPRKSPAYVVETERFLGTPVEISGVTPLSYEDLVGREIEFDGIRCPPFGYSRRYLKVD